MNTFSKRLNKKIKERKKKLRGLFKISDLCERIDLTESGFYTYMKKNSSIKLERALSICQVLDLNHEESFYLLTGMKYNPDEKFKPFEEQ